MQKKLGPLKLYQWALIGAVAGLAIYLWRRSQTGSPGATPVPADAAAALSPTQGVIDPTTGTSTGNPGLDATGDPTVPVPLSELLGLAQGQGSSLTGGDAASAAVNDPSAAFDNQLSEVGTLLDLVGKVQDLINPAAPSAASGAAATSVNTGQSRPPQPPDPKAGGHYVYIPGRNWVLIHWDQAKKKWIEGPVPTKPAPKPKSQHPSNPGHTNTNHGGRTTTSSSAPHNARQHQNVQPPNHQRHHPTKVKTRKRAPAKPQPHKPGPMAHPIYRY